MLRTIAFILAMTVGISAAVWTRFGGLLFYLWFSLFRPQDWVWIDVEAFRLSLFAGALFVLPSLLSGVWPNLTHPISIGSILFLANALVAQTNAIDPATGWFWLDFLFRQVLVSLLFISIVNTPRRYTVAIAVIACSLAFHASKFGAGYLLGGGVRYDTNIGGAFGSTNEFSLAVSRVLFLLIAAAQNIAVPWVSLGMFFSVPFTVLGIISTFSRGGFLAVACATTLFLVLQRRRALAMAAVGVAAVVAYLLVPVPDSYVNRLNTITTYEEVGDRSALGRLHFWRVATLMAAAEPMGVGLRNFEANYDRFDFSGGQYGTSRSSHSVYFQVLAETGYIGAAIFLWLLGYAFWITLRVRRRAGSLPPEARRFFFTTSNALAASLVAFAIGGAFAAEALNELNWFTFALVACLDRISRDAVAAANPSSPVVQPAKSSPADWRPAKIAAQTGTSLAGPRVARASYRR